jgi:hypothetical protein
MLKAPMTAPILTDALVDRGDARGAPATASSAGGIGRRRPNARRPEHHARYHPIPSQRKQEFTEAGKTPQVVPTSQQRASGA